AAGKDALARFNRSYEYDGLGDAYARFLLDELLPAVEGKTTSDGRKIVLSKSGNDRAIGGSRRGGGGAVTAAGGGGGRVRPRVQHDRHLRRLARGERLPDPDPEVRAEAAPRLPPGRRERPEHLRRRLVDGEPGDGAGAEVRRVRGGPRLGQGRAQRDRRDEAL